jgi:hypothetical protein
VLKRRIELAALIPICIVIIYEIRPFQHQSGMLVDLLREATIGGVFLWPGSFLPEARQPLKMKKQNKKY